MGVMKQQATPKDAKRSGEQSTLDWGNLARPVNAVGVDWGDADPNLVTSLLRRATRRGMAVSFSATANGTGVSITILDGGERPKFYANTGEQLNELLERLLDIIPAG